MNLGTEENQWWRRRFRGRAAQRVAAANVAVMFMGSTLVTPLYPIYREKFGFSEITLTLIYAAYVLGNLVALLLFGRLSDQVGRRPVALAAIGIAVGSTTLFLLARATAWLFVARAMSGLAIGIAAGAATAWVAELIAEEDKQRASIVAASANFAGSAIGPLLAGLLAQHAGAPLHLSYVVYLWLLAPMVVLLDRTEETVGRRLHSLQQVSLRPRIGVPRGIRARFLSPALTAFATFSLIGFYGALAPSLLSRDLHEHNPAIAGAIVSELFLVAAISTHATGRFKSRTAMILGAATLIPSAVLLLIAQAFKSLPILIIGTALSGLSAGLGNRGSLQVVNEIAPGDKRAEVLSSYLLVCYLGNSLPVVGVGVASTALGPLSATIGLTSVIAVFALVALTTELRHGSTAQVAMRSRARPS